MSLENKPLNLFRMLLILTGLAIFTQILFLYLNSLTNHVIETFISDSITTEVLRSRIFITGLVKFLAAQIIVYSVFIAAIWYLAISAGELLRLRERTTYLIGIALWLLSAITITAANTYLTPNSFFASLVRNTALNGNLSIHALKITASIGAIMLALAGAIASVNLCQQLSLRKNIFRHSVTLTFLLGLVILQLWETIATQPVTHTTATSTKPNVIIIGLDALRPDFIGFNQTKKTARTPTIDKFLSDAVNFAGATTTLARTFPSWSSILTSAYPLHNHVRGNNTNLAFINVDNTIPKEFRKAGYATLYGTDDTRFNNTTEMFGFDHIISPTMGLDDLIFGSINDFPLTNLLITTAVGQLLFPYNFANHGTAITYAPNNFLQLIEQRLHQRDGKPLFLAVHFTLSHWPFYWFNDRQPLANRTLERYQASITGVDAQLNQFLKILAENKLLDHAIVILLSDHGLSLGLPAERPIATTTYQGDKANIKKIPLSHYSTPSSAKNTPAYDIDTSYGYGGDILSLKQYHTLLAFKGYGLAVGKPHTVTERVSLMDIGPTLLALLQLAPLRQTDGISLTPYLFETTPATDSTTRQFFLETTFSIDALEKETISVSSVLEKTVRLYEVNYHTGLISIKLDAEKIMNHDKQFGILQGDWLLAQYPRLERGKLRFKGNDMISEKYIQPAFYILVNLKTGLWTTELNSTFAQQSPARELLQELRAFYGAELDTYEKTAKLGFDQASLAPTTR